MSPPQPRPACTGGDFPACPVLNHSLTIDLKLASGKMARLPGLASKFVEMELGKVLARERTFPSGGPLLPHSRLWGPVQEGQTRSALDPFTSHLSGRPAAGRGRVSRLGLWCGVVGMWF